jgi:hypothetical protein
MMRYGVKLANTDATIVAPASFAIKRFINEAAI